MLKKLGLYLTIILFMLSCGQGIVNIYQDPTGAIIVTTASGLYRNTDTNPYGYWGFYYLSPDGNFYYGRTSNSESKVIDFNLWGKFRISGNDFIIEYSDGYKEIYPIEFVQAYLYFYFSGRDSSPTILELLDGTGGYSINLPESEGGGGDE